MALRGREHIYVSFSCRMKQTVLFKEGVKGNTQTYNINNLASGIYAIEITDQGKTKRIKFVKE